MFTPTEQATPGSTPIMDPLQLQFLTGGQMQYMPQAQFMTPSAYGAFRTMPNPMVNGAPSESGIFHNWMVADRGAALFGLLPEYTVNTFNPAISPVQQQTYAQRRLDDAWSTGMATVGSLGLATTLGGLSLVPGLGLAGLALGMFAPDIARPVTERMHTTREIQDMTTAKIFSGDDLDTSLGYGFKASRARDLDRFMRAEAADDRIFDSGDYHEMLKLGMQYGQFDYTNNAADYKRILKNMRDIMSTMMQVMGSEDLKDIMENMKRMQSMGLTMEQYSAVARKEQAYSRMTGLSYNDMVETYGKSGSLIFQQAGLNPMQGDIQSMANAANMTYLQRTGVLNPVITAKFGGISGLTQELTAQDAKVHKSLKDIILPAMMDDKLEHLRTDIDFNAVLKNPTMLQQFINESAGKIRTPEQWLSYNQHKDVAYAELSKKYDTETAEMEFAKQTGQMAGFRGRRAYESGLVILGMGTEEAALKTTAYLSEEARAARRRAQEEGDIAKHEEIASKYSPMGRLSRELSKFFTGTGEWLFAAFTGTRFSDQTDTRTKAQRDYGGVARPGINLGNPFTPTEKDSGYNGNPLPPLTDLSDDKAVTLLNGTGLMTPEEARNYMLLLPNTLVKEAGTMDPDAASAKIDKKNNAVGALQLDIGSVSGMFNSEFFKGTNFKDKYWHDVDFSKVAAGEPEALHGWYEGRKKASKDWEYLARETSYIRQNVTKDRLNTAEKKHGSRVAKLRKSIPAMMMLTSIMNQTSTATSAALFDKLFDEKTGAFGTEEKLDSLLKDEYGLGAVRAISDAALTLTVNGKQPLAKFPERYDATKKDSEYGLIRDYVYGRTGNFRETWNNIMAESVVRMSRHPGYDTDYSQSKTKYQPDLGYETRPDCSGLVCGVLSDFDKVSGGMALPPELRQYTRNNRTDAATYYDRMLKVNGGKDDVTIDVQGKTTKELNAEILEKLPVNSFVYLQKKSSDGKNRNITHVAMVVKDPVTGKPMLVDQRGKKEDLQRVSLEDALNGYTHPTKGEIAPLINRKEVTKIHAIRFGSVIKPTKYAIPAHKEPVPNIYDDPKVLKETIEANEKARAELLDRNLAHGGTVMEAHTWNNIVERSGTFDQQRLLDVMKEPLGYTVTGNELNTMLSMFWDSSMWNGKAVEGSSKIAKQLKDDAVALGIDADFSKPLQERLSKLDWKDFVATKPGKNATEKQKEKYEENRKLWRAAVAAQMYISGGEKFTSLSIEERNKRIDAFMADQNSMLNLMAAVYQQGKKGTSGYHANYEKMANEAHRAGSEVSSDVRDKGYNKTSKDVFLGTFGSIFGLTEKDMGEEAPIKTNNPMAEPLQPGAVPPSEMLRINLGLMDKLRDTDDVTMADTKAAFNIVASNTTVVGSTGRKEGEYYMQAPRIMALYNEYANADSGKRNYTPEQKEKIKKTLVTAARTFGIKDTAAFTKMLEEGRSTVDFTNEFLKMSGVSDPTKNESAQKLLKTTAEWLSPKNENNAYKFDLDAFLKKYDFSQFNPVTGQSTSALLTGDRVRDALLSLNELLPGVNIRDFHKKGVVTDLQANQFYEMAEKRGLGLVADELKKARDAGKEIDMSSLYRKMEAAGMPLGAPTGPNGGGASGGYKPGQQAPNPTGALVPPTGLNPLGDMGSSGAIFKPETEMAFQKLPIVLERVEKTLADLNSTIGHEQVQPKVK